MRIYRLCLALSIFAMLVWVTGCKTITHRIPDRQGVNDAIRLMCQKPSFKTMEARVNVTLKMGKQKQSAKGVIRMVRDSAVQISIQPLLGIELLRIVATPQQLTVIDRVNQYYFRQTKQALPNQFVPLFDLQVLQSLFTARLFSPGKQQLTPADFEIEAEDTDIILKSKHNEATVETFFRLDELHFLEETFIGNKKELNYAACKYSDYGLCSNGETYPSKLMLEACFSAKKNEVELDFGTFEFNHSVQISDAVSSKYKQISASQVMILLDQLK